MYCKENSGAFTVHYLGHLSYSKEARTQKKCKQGNVKSIKYLFFSLVLLHIVIKWVLTFLSVHLLCFSGGIRGTRMTSCVLYLDFDIHVSCSCWLIV